MVTMPTSKCIILIDKPSILETNVSDHRNIDNDKLSQPLCLAVLRLLTYLGSKGPMDLNHFQWGHIFFDSGGRTLQVVEKQKFDQLNSRTFEEFEKRITSQIVNFEGTLEVGSLERCNSIKVLEQVLIQVVSDYTWSEPDVFSSPIKPLKIRKVSNGSMRITEQQNYVFLIASLARYKNIEAIEKTMSRNFFQNILKPSLLKMFREENNIKLFFVECGKSVYNAVKAPLQSLPSCGIISFQALVYDLNSCLLENSGSLTWLKSSLPPSCVIGCLLHKEEVAKKDDYPHTSVQLVLNSEIKCQAEICPMTFEKDHSYYSLGKWTELEVIASLELNAAAFPLLSGVTYVLSVKDSNCFSSLMMKCNERNQLLVIKCNESLHGILRPMTLSAACLIIPPCDFFKTFINSNNVLETNRDILVSPFHASCLEKWAVPQILKLGNHLSKVEKTASSNKLLQKLQSTYKPTNRLKMALKPQSAQEFVLPKSSSKLRKTQSANLNISTRSSDLVRKSLNVKRNIQSNQTCVKGHHDLNRKIVKSDLITNLHPPSTSEELLTRLKTLRDQAINGEGSLINCAKTIVNDVESHVKLNQNSWEPVLKFLRDNFMLSAQAIAERFDSPSRKSKRILEYQLQVLILMELEIVLKENSFKTNCAEKVISLLRPFSFVAGTTELNNFLKNTLCQNFSSTLRLVLEEISEELNVPLYPDSDDELSNLWDQFPLSVKSSSSRSTASVCSQREDKRSLTRHPSLTFGCQRQIQVPKLVVQRNKRLKLTAEKKKKSQALRSSRTNISCRKNKPTMGSRSNRQEVRKVRRNLFESEKFQSPRKKGKVSNSTPETPQGKSLRKSKSKRMPSNFKDIQADDFVNKKQTSECSKPQRCSPRIKKKEPLTRSSSFMFQELMASPPAFKQNPNKSPAPPLTEIIKPVTPKHTKMSSSPSQRVLRTPKSSTPETKQFTPKLSKNAVTPKSSKITPTTKTTTPTNERTPKRTIQTPRRPNGTPIKSKLLAPSSLFASPTRNSSRNLGNINTPSPKKIESTFEKRILRTPLKETQEIRSPRIQTPKTPKMLMNIPSRSSCSPKTSQSQEKKNMQNKSEAPKVYEEPRHSKMSGTNTFNSSLKSDSKETMSRAFESKRKHSPIFWNIESDFSNLASPSNGRNSLQHWPIKKPIHRSESEKRKLFRSSPSNFEETSPRIKFISPPLKKICKGSNRTPPDKSYLPPSTMSILHLTSSPVCDI